MGTEAGIRVPRKWRGREKLVAGPVRERGELERGTTPEPVLVLVAEVGRPMPTEKPVAERRG